MRNRNAVKGLIRLAQSIDEADKILSEEFSTVQEKYAYLINYIEITIIIISTWGCKGIIVG